MRRPYLPLRSRLQRRATAVGRDLPLGLRRKVRRTAEGWGLTSSTSRPHATPTPADAEVVAEFDAWNAIAELAAELRATLVAAQVEVVHLESNGQIILVVPREQRTSALDAVREAAASARWWAVDRDNRCVRLGSPEGLDVVGDNLAIFRPLASSDGLPVAGTELSVRLQFWQTVTRPTPRPDGGNHPVGTRLAPQRNRVAPYLAPTQWQKAQAHPERRLELRKPHLLELHEPVDIVYTWVDGSDPAWQARRRAVRPASETLAVDALDPARTTDRDELRYSLRSVFAYANWVRHIWLVTDGQIPDWLIEDHPRLTVVSHPEIFTDRSALPTFNSHAIESQLHHIDGLAEHFLYLNDDVFFGRPVRPELFFHGNGLAKFAVSLVTVDAEPTPGKLNGAMLAARQGRTLIERDFGRTVTHRMQHIPHAHLRSSLADFEAAYPELVDQVAHSRFRSREDVSIAADLGHYFAYAQGRAVSAHVDFRYVDIGSPLAVEQLDSLLALRDQDCFCLNDVGDYPTPVDHVQLMTFLTRYFPVPSPFERPDR